MKELPEKGRRTLRWPDSGPTALPWGLGMGAKGLRPDWRVAHLGCGPAFLTSNQNLSCVALLVPVRQEVSPDPGSRLVLFLSSICLLLIQVTVRFLWGHH